MKRVWPEGCAVCRTEINIPPSGPLRGHDFVTTASQRPTRSRGDVSRKPVDAFSIANRGWLLVALSQLARGSAGARLGGVPGARNLQITTSASICGRRSGEWRLGLFHPSVQREVSVEVLNISYSSIRATRRFVHCARRSDRPKRRTVTLRASVGSTEVTVCLRSSTLTTPCARAPRRYAEAKNFPIGIAHSWSWAIGSSTSAARRSFDVVVSRR